MIKAVIFDYFGVICSDEYWRFVKEDKNIQGEFHNLSDAVNVGSLHWQDFIAKVAKKTGANPQKIQGLYEAARINPELIGYITNLRHKYKTGLLTNGHYEFLEPRIVATHLDEAFDAIVISSRVGVVKPAPEIYCYTLNQLGVEPQEAVLVDDIMRNVEGAKRVGLHAILYENFGQMKSELEKLITHN